MGGLGTPPLLMGATLIFWGWQTGYLVIGILLAAGLEASRLINRRIEFSDKDYARISDLCAVVFGAMFVYRLAAETGSAARWIPIAFFPILAAQTFGVRRGVPLSAIFWTYRKQAAAHKRKPIPEIGLGYFYFALCLMAAGAANVRHPGFYAGLLALCGWALWGVRPKNGSGIVWAVLLVLVGTAGWVGQEKLHQLHLWVEKKGVDWLVSEEERDTFRNATAIGEIGELKLSDRIAFRMKPGRPGPVKTYLLREASYNVYRNGRWFAADAAFRDVPATGRGDAWVLGPPAEAVETLIVQAPLRKGQGLLKLAAGAFRVDGLDAGRVEANQYGAVRVHDGPGLVEYTVSYGPGVGGDGPPVEKDLALPERDAAVLARVVAELKLAEYPDREKLDVLLDYFNRYFKYSLVTASPEAGEPAEAAALEDFLIRSRAGHCEYFGTAATLLLRAAGVPARYAAGYSAQEYSRFERAYVVRDRHAHSWALAYVDGAWLALDATPPDWSKVENERASLFEPLLDAWSWLGFQFSKWRWSEKSGKAKYVWWLVVPLLLILGRRLFFKKKVSRTTPVFEEEKREAVRPGADSDMYRVERRLAELGYVRGLSETLSGLVARVESSEVEGAPIDGLRPILALHYRLRFAPGGLTEPERSELKQRVDDWLKVGVAADKPAEGQRSIG